MTDWITRVRRELGSASEVPDDDVIEELGQHLQEMADRAIRCGRTRQEADASATAQLAIWCRDAGTLRRARRRAGAVQPPPAASAYWTGVGHDLRYAIRLLHRQPRYAVVAVATLAVAVGTTSALFGISYAVLLKPLPWPHAERLVVASERRGGQPPRFGAFSDAAYFAWRDGAQSIDELGAWSDFTATFTDGGEPERMPVVRATASLFSTLGVTPAAGRLFTRDDELSDDVALLGEGTWRNRYGRDASVIGRIVRVDGRPRRVVGVVPDSLAFPDRDVRAWVPLPVTPPLGDSMSMFNVVARLRPGATPGQAAEEATARGRFAAKTDMTAIAIFGSAGPIEIAVQPLGQAMAAGVRRPLLVLLVAVGFLLLLATANVAGLQLARATTRRRELAIRAAIGASPARVVRQLVIESLLLGVAGGAAGLALAFGLQRAAPSVLPAGFPRGDQIGPGLASALCAIVLGILASLAFGSVPALGVRRLNLTESLAEGIAATGGSTRAPVMRARMAIMAGQVALACVLLVGAMLLARSFHALATADRGYDPSGVLTARVALPAALFTSERRHALVETILRRLDALSGVDAAAIASEVPLTPGGSTSSFGFRARNGAIVSGRASPRIVSPGYFRTLNLRLVAGRGFDESDASGGPVVVVNRSFARRYLGASPLEARLPIVAYQGAGDGDAAVVGVVDDVRYPMAADSGLPEIYYHHRQFGGALPVPVVHILIRTSGDPSALAPALRTIVRDTDPDLVPEAIAPMHDRMLRTLAAPRLYALLLAGFAAAGVLVAVVGLFGVASYVVAQRSREIAVRMALGAARASVARMVVTQGLAITAIGVAAGLVGSLALTRSMAALLYGVSPRDGVTLLVVPAVLLAVAAAACAGPAVRAARVDPMRAMRE